MVSNNCHITLVHIDGALRHCELVYLTSTLVISLKSVYQWIMIIFTWRYYCSWLAQSIAGDLGCSTNVIRLLDEACSGKVSCEYTLPNKDLFATQPCPRGVYSYLEVSYDCIKGMLYTYICIRGSVVECSPVTHASRVRFPADADICEQRCG